MVQIVPQPFQMKDCVVTIGTDAYERQVSEVTFTPNISSSKWRGLTPGAVYSDALWDWDVTINGAQDHETAGSLTAYLFAQKGTKQTLIFKPKSGSGPSYQIVITVVPGAFGGKVGAWAESAVTFPADGEPLTIPATPGLPVPALASPATGGIAGGTMVTITGSGFAGATAVHFGTTAVPTADWTLVSPTVIVAKAPAQAAGSKPIKVTNATGQSTAAAAFTYA